MSMGARHDDPRTFPRLPVLGWSSFSGAYRAPLPDVSNARQWRYTISGRAAIGLALRVLGVEAGTTVLVPTYHCPTMIAPIVQAGAHPMFYPITASGAPDLQWLRGADLTSVRALLAAHYFGLPQPMAVVRSFCVEHGVALIEDCAHAFFGISDDAPVGGWGDVAIASLPKVFPVPEGGIIASATRELNGLDLTPRGWHGQIKAAVDAVELGARYGRFPGLNAPLRGLFAVKNWTRRSYEPPAVATTGGAAAGAVPAAEHLLAASRPALIVRGIASAVYRARIVELRRRNYVRLAHRLEKMSGAHALRPDLPEHAVPYVFPLYVDDPAASYDRLRSAGIPIFRWDDIWPGTPVIASDHGLTWATHVFQLGCHQDLSLEDIDAVADAVRHIVQDAPRRHRADAAAAPESRGAASVSGRRKRVLMIAFHFPPLAGSSGIQRTLRFARHLPQFGWEPLILTAHPRAYPHTSDDQLDDIPPGSVVERAFALDSNRHFAVAGRCPTFLARPDRWMTWWLGAVLRGVEMIRRYRPQAIWSTFPIATAHRIGYTLHRLSGVPWVADFRDLMAQEGYPSNPRMWRSYKRIEERTLRAAWSSVFATPSAARIYLAHYPDADGRLAVIENGYDEESFAMLDASGGDAGPLTPGALTLLHSGTIYPNERDPTRFFEALRRLRDDGSLRGGELRVRLRASGHDAVLKPMIESYGLTEIVELVAPLPYRDALREMMRADGLLVLQAANCNAQIPAKVYEYLRCRRPIMALTDPGGDTAAMLRRAGIPNFARLDCAEEIALELRRFLDEVRAGGAALPDDAAVASASRLRRTEELVTLLERLAVASE
jgi:dTDP-4-amino-4,6-dideoxygalactose transaminase/glycosyltransferase involved in cell wall biosynthesis